jgi:branched-chain amino acid transport system substrate-binding protein
MGWQPSYQTEGRIYAKYLLQSLPSARVAVLYQNDDYGKDYLKGLMDGLGAQAKMVVAKESYDVSEPTIDSHILNLKASDADVLLDFATPKFAAQSIKKVHEIGWKPTFILNNVSASVGGVLKPAGIDAAQGVISAAYLKDPTDPSWSDDAGMKKWRQFMRQYQPDADTSDSSNVFGYSVAQTLVQVLRHCGADLSSGNVMKQAASLHDYDPGLLLPGVKINTSPTDFAPIEQLQLMRFKGGSWERFGPVMNGAAQS